MYIRDGDGATVSVCRVEKCRGILLYSKRIAPFCPYIQHAKIRAIRGRIIVRSQF